MKPMPIAHEFEAVLDERGRIAVPADIAGRYGGRRIHVRLQPREVSAALAKREVTEEEVERIASVQLEPREQVIAFLMSEGALRGHRGFTGRARKLWQARPGTRR